MEEKRKRRAYSTRDLQLMQDMREHGYTIKEISHVLGRSEKAVESTLYYYNLPRRTCKRWSEDEDFRAIHLYNTGAGASCIAEILGRSPDSVLARLKRLREMGLTT